MSRIHLAILYPALLDAIRQGRKTVESRLGKDRRLPYGAVAPGDRILLKYSGGPVAATAIAGRVHQFSDLTPAAVDSLRREWNSRIQADEVYWQRRRQSRYATLIEIDRVEVPLPGVPPPPRSNGAAWFALVDGAWRRRASRTATRGTEPGANPTSSAVPARPAR